jgi:hypothetical protein
VAFFVVALAVFFGGIFAERFGDSLVARKMGFKERCGLNYGRSER